MDLHYLDDLASRIRTSREKMERLRHELAELDARMRDREIEVEFARLIGYSYDDEDAESMKARLRNEMDALEESIRNDMEAFMNGLTSQDLIIPIEPNPVQHDEGQGVAGAGKSSTRGMVYRYRDDAKFTNFVALLSMLLGKSTVKDVTFMDDCIVVNAMNEREAKQRFVNSIREMQRMLAKKVAGMVTGS